MSHTCCSYSKIKLYILTSRQPLHIDIYMMPLVEAVPFEITTYVLELSFSFDRSIGGVMFQMVQDNKSRFTRPAVAVLPTYQIRKLMRIQYVHKPMPHF